MPLPFEDSRRLLGANLFFASTGAVLDAVGESIDTALSEAWRVRVLRAAERLGWPPPQTVVRLHAAGVSLALSAPLDQLFVATEVNEWALCATLAEREPERRNALEAALFAQALEAAAEGTLASSIVAPVLDEPAAFARFETLSKTESNPRLRALLEAATSRTLPYAVDEAELTLGAGSGGRQFPLAQLPLPAAVGWDELHDIPTVLVTGSNGKTTTVRLLAAFARAHGWHAGYNCTDGVFLDDEALATGDYSGPAGARTVLRDPRTQAAILETARGGILRRGIAVSQADVAIVTNVSSDHFGEYGIDDLAGLAEVKLVVAAAVKPDGMLILNADDPLLRAKAADLPRRHGRRLHLAWFSVNEHHADVDEYRAQGASTAIVNAGRLQAHYRGTQYELGSIVDMPLSLGGIATYNIANLAGAALTALGLGIAPTTIATVLTRFGGDVNDNPGRLMRFQADGVQVLVDYAHNPEGLRGFLAVARHLRGAGRLGLLLGHAGNRKNEDIEALASVAAEFAPDLVVVKENEAQLRGRARGEVPSILRAALLRFGVPAASLRQSDSELAAAQSALQWARPGDVLAFPVHSLSARGAVIDMLGKR